MCFVKEGVVGGALRRTLRGRGMLKVTFAKAAAAALIGVALAGAGPALAQNGTGAVTVVTPAVDPAQTLADELAAAIAALPANATDAQTEKAINDAVAGKDPLVVKAAIAKVKAKAAADKKPLPAKATSALDKAEAKANLALNNAGGTGGATGGQPFSQSNFKGDANGASYN